MRQKVGYLESVNAELCEQLERCDAEAFSHQGGLQAEKAELAARMRQLQEEVRPLLSASQLCIGSAGTPHTTVSSLFGDMTGQQCACTSAQPHD